MVPRACARCRHAPEVTGSNPVVPTKKPSCMRRSFVRSFAGPVPRCEQTLDCGDEDINHQRHQYGRRHERSKRKRPGLYGRTDEGENQSEGGVNRQPNHDRGLPSRWGAAHTGDVIRSFRAVGSGATSCICGTAGRWFSDSDVSTYTGGSLVDSVAIVKKDPSSATLLLRNRRQFELPISCAQLRQILQ